MDEMDSIVIAFLHVAVKPIKGQMKHFSHRYHIIGLHKWHCGAHSTLSDINHKELKQETEKLKGSQTETMTVHKYDRHFIFTVRMRA